MVEKGPNNTQMLLTEHTQRRMDERGVTVPDLKVTFENFLKWFNDEKSRHSPFADTVTRKMNTGDRIVWEDKKLGLETVFMYQKGRFIVITSYWYGVPNPRMPAEGCPA